MIRQEFDGFPHGLGTVSGSAALETDIVLVVHVLERPESGLVVVLRAVLSRHQSAATAGDVDVLEVLDAG